MKERLINLLNMIRKQLKSEPKMSRFKFVVNGFICEDTGQDLKPWFPFKNISFMTIHFWVDPSIYWSSTLETMISQHLLIYGMFKLTEQETFREQSFHFCHDLSLNLAISIASSTVDPIQNSRRVTLHVLFSPNSHKYQMYFMAMDTAA